VASKSAEITGPSLFVLVEGKDDEFVIRRILEPVLGSVEVRSVGGVPEFSKEARVLVKSAIFRSTARRIVLVRDADRDARSARKSADGVMEGLRKNDKQFRSWCATPGRTCAAIVLPVGKHRGSLEDVLVDAWLGKPEIRNCAQQAIDKCRAHLPKAGWNESKAVLQSMLALGEGNHHSIGTAWDAGLFDPESKALITLRDQITGWTQR